MFARSQLTPAALLGLALLVLCGCQSPEPQLRLELPELEIDLPAIAEESFKPHRPGAPLLWRASKERVEFYLFGSLHAGDEGVAAFWPVIEGAFAASDEIAMEISPDELDAANYAALLDEHGIIDPPDSLRTRLAPDTFAALEQALLDFGVEPEEVMQVEPWVFILSMMAGATVSEGLRPELGVEHILTGKAREWNGDAGGEQQPEAGVGVPRVAEMQRLAKPIVGLESVESQLLVFAGLSHDLQSELLARFLEPPARAIGPSVPEIVAAWRRGSAEALASQLGTTDPVMQEFYEALIYERNERMTERLIELSRDGKTRLVIVGAFHMVGERGIPALLARRGFEIELLE